MRILEYMDKKALKPVGGPVGYLFGLFETDKESNRVLNFIEYESTNNIQTKKKTQKKTISVLRQKAWFAKILLCGKRERLIEENAYDVIHFHLTIDLFNVRRSLSKYKGKTILTSHCPTMPYKEIYNAASKWERILFYPIFMLLRFADIGAFKLADYIIFPCEEAEEPYAHAWKGFRKFKQKNMSKFKYVPSGTYQRTAKVSRDEVRNKLNIPQNAFVISYVGRHNEIKGYDVLKKIGENILNRSDNVYFVIAGKEEPLKGLNHPRWIEVGWTNDPHSYIAASDLFILPNRETYFDLVLLEVLSLGTMIVASNTGGNKFFQGKVGAGLVLYDKQEDAIMRISEAMNMNRNERLEVEAENRKFFLSRFESNIFYQNYLDVINEVYYE